MRPATIIHVAELAKVSLKTVSRVMNNEPNVTTRTREKVMAAVDQLGYTPSIAARRMGGSKSYLLIAFNDRQLTLENWRSPRGSNWVDQMLYGAMQACEASGYHLMFELIDLQDLQLERRLVSVLSSLKPDGVILTPPNSDNPTVLRALEERGVPYVRMGSTLKGGGHAVFMDDILATQVVVRHLLDLGHRRIGFIAGSFRHLSSLHRVESFITVMADGGIAVPDDWVRRGDFSYESGTLNAEALLDLACPPTAIIASNDAMALAALHVAQQRGLNVPGDLSLVSFDDSPGVRFSAPPLTAVRQPVAEMAGRSVELLIAIVAGVEPEGLEHKLDFELIVRDSTGAARPGGARALA